MAGSDLVALIDDESEPDPSRKALRPEEAARVWGLIHRYRSWFDAYWAMLAAMKLSDEMDTLPEDSDERARLAKELGTLLAAQPDIQLAPSELSELLPAMSPLPAASEVEAPAGLSALNDLIKQAHQAASKRRLSEARTVADQAYSFLSESVDTDHEEGREHIPRLAMTYQVLGNRSRERELLARVGSSPTDTTLVMAAAGGGAGKRTSPRG